MADGESWVDYVGYHLFSVLFYVCPLIGGMLIALVKNISFLYISIMYGIQLHAQ